MMLIYTKPTWTHGLSCFPFLFLKRKSTKKNYVSFKTWRAPPENTQYFHAELAWNESHRADLGNPIHKVWYSLDCPSQQSNRISLSKGFIKKLKHLPRFSSLIFHLSSVYIFIEYVNLKPQNSWVFLSKTFKILEIRKIILPAFLSTK